MPYHAGRADAQRIEQSDYAPSVCAKRERASSRRIAAPVPEEIDDHETVPGGHLRDDVTPEMTRRGKPVVKTTGSPVPRVPAA